MREVISSLLHTDIENVNVKATRREGLGFIGNKEGISAEAVVLLCLKN
jgi:2-C-methyl-D-erythritol 2,4-cyclodiphosphate synthase